MSRAKFDPSKEFCNVLSYELIRCFERIHRCKYVGRNHRGFEFRENLTESWQTNLDYHEQDIIKEIIFALQLRLNYIEHKLV